MSLVISGVGLEESAFECATQGLAFSRIEDPLLAAASACGDKTVLVDGDDVLSYVALGEAVRDFAPELQAHGLAPDDGVSVFLDKTLQCVIALYGACLAGGILVPVNEGLRPRQVYHILANSGSRFLVTNPRKLADFDSGSLGSTEVLDAAAIGQPAHRDPLHLGIDRPAQGHPDLPCQPARGLKDRGAVPGAETRRRTTRPELSFAQC